MGRTVSAARGTSIRCKGWRQEGILRMLENTVENAENPDELIIYAASGKAARSWLAFDRLVASLKSLEEDETLVVQSGKPVAVFRTRRESPRVLIANAHLVPKWATWEVFRKLQALGLTMYGQYTAGMWAYIGTQGILQLTYETLNACGRRHFGGTLRGRLVVTAGLGAMGGAQPLAITLNGGVALVVEVDERRIDRRMKLGYCDSRLTSLDEALEAVEIARRQGQARSVALLGNAADVLPELVRRGVRPDAVTDQTSAHDLLDGYIPAGYTVAEAEELRRRDPETYIQASLASIRKHVEAMLAFHRGGAVVFEYGNNIREQAQKAGVEGAFAFQGFIPLFIRPEFCIGRGPVRWVTLSGDPEDLRRIDEAIVQEFPGDASLVNWIRMAPTRVPPQGLPARTSWLAYGDRVRFGLMVNRMVGAGLLRAPVAMTRDHLDCGSVAQPTRETENMKDGSDAVADWPLLNALLNTAAGADLVAIHQGGGSGMGGSISAGATLIIDGTGEAEEKIRRVLEVDPGIGVVRHADAGYEESLAVVRRTGIRMPMLEGEDG